MASEDAATESQIKKLHAVLHSLGIDPKDWKKERNIASYARLTRGQCSEYIEELEKLEAEKKGGATKRQEQEIRDRNFRLEEAHAQAEVSKMAVVMKFCAIEAQKIVEEMSNGGITEGQKVGMIQKFATTMFIEAMKRGLC